MTLFVKIAELLETLAAEKDKIASQPTAPDPLLTRLEGRVGQVPESVRSKLAEDDDLRRILTPILETPETPRALGGPSEKDASDSTPMSKAERLRAAEDQFARTVMSRRHG